MDYETALDTERERPEQGARLTSHLAGLAHDAARIVELQARLMACDFKSFRAGLTRAAVMWFVAGVMLLAVLPVALGGLGLGLAELADWSPAVGLLVASAVGLVLMLLLALAGWWQLKKQAAGFDRSRQELQENLRALRQVVADYAGRGAEE